MNDRSYLKMSDYSVSRHDRFTGNQSSAIPVICNAEATCQTLMHPTLHLPCAHPRHSFHNIFPLTPHVPKVSAKPRWHPPTSVQMAIWLEKYMIGLAATLWVKP
nr:unnamed protein product [Spirometra erinaceieuropaei]